MTVEACAGLPLARSTATAVLRMVFQPVVDLRTTEVVGFEALARGPAGSPWESPRALFDQARTEGRLREMDWACRVAAVRQVRTRFPVWPAWRLFVNTEPEVLGTLCPEDLVADWVGGASDLGLVVELTERALVHGPRRLLQAVSHLRALGCEIALDDVGANAASVALLPLVEPDVVKLDAALLRASSRSATRRSLRAIAAYVERTGAVVVAEGIETERDHERALDLGAQWGQGYLFGRPAPLELGDAAVPDQPSPLRRVARRPRSALPSPQPGAPRLVVEEHWVREQLRAVLAAAGDVAATNVVLLACPDSRLLPETFSEQLAELQESCALCLVVLDHGVATSPRASDDSWGRATVAVVLGASGGQCMVARPAGSGRYEVVLTEDPDDVPAAARAVLRAAG